jgi:hypothetical protein
MFRLLAAAALLVAVWWPATGVPYWQDDYGFLLAAREARLAGDSRNWLAPDPPLPIWRPIGAGLWWRFVEGPLGGNARAAHLASLAALLAAASAVGWLAASIRRHLPAEGGPDAIGPGRERTTGAGVVAGLMYGLHGAHVLPVAWVSAANDSLAVLFGALALRAWLAALARTGRRAIFAAAGALLGYAAALLSRESSVVLPVLGVVLVLWVRPRARAARPAWAARACGVGALALGLAWLLLRASLATDLPAAYAPQAGVNLARNAASLSLFLLGMPREALRFLIASPSFAIAAWAAACVVLQAGAFALLLRGAGRRLPRRAMTLLAVFVATAFAPFLPVAWNSYEYYVSFALLAPAFVAALAADRPRVSAAAVALTAAASLLATTVALRLPEPALAARARWAERQLGALERQREADSRLARGPILVRSDDARRFQAFGAAGLAYRLGLDRREIRPAPESMAPPAGAVWVTVPARGDIQVK